MRFEFENKMTRCGSRHGWRQLANGCLLTVHVAISQWCTLASGQTPDALPNSSLLDANSVAAPAPPDGGNTEEMYQVLDRLKRERQQMVTDVQAMNQSTLSRNSSRAKSNRDIVELRRQLDRESTASANQAKRIRGKLDRLRQLVDDGAFCATDESATSAPHAAALDRTAPTAIQSDASQLPEETSGHTDSKNVKPEQKFPAVDMRKVTADAVDAIGRPLSKSIEPAQSVPEAVVKALAIVDGPVDSLRFANNLYGSGEYQLALEIYQKIERATLTANQKVWIEYQLANCYRRVGNNPLAERSYRIVLSLDRDGWIGQNSRWWLEVGGQAAAMEQSIQAVGHNLEQLSKKDEMDGQPKD